MLREARVWRPSTGEGTAHSVGRYSQMFHKQYCILTEPELITVKLHKF